MATTSLAKKKFALKRALTWHLSGIGIESGLVHKSYVRLNQLIASNDESIALNAIDKVIKLMAYAIDKEGGQASGTIGQGGPVNIQINNFDSFLRDRLSTTNLGKLLNDIDLQQTPNVGTQNNVVPPIDPSP